MVFFLPFVDTHIFVQEIIEPELNALPAHYRNFNILTSH
jgi:hypothetical protein